MELFKSKYHKIFPPGICHDQVEDFKDSIMLRIVNLTDIGECAIYLFGGEVDEPHIHIVGNNFESAVCLLHPLYYDIHNNIDIMTDKQINEFVSVLDKETARWWWVRLLWDGANPHRKINRKANLGFPNYTKLKGGKDNVFWSKFRKQHK